MYCRATEFMENKVHKTVRTYNIKMIWLASYLIIGDSNMSPYQHMVSTTTQGIDIFTDGTVGLDWGDITGRHLTCPVKGRPGSGVIYREAKRWGI